MELKSLARFGEEKAMNMKSIMLFGYLLVSMLPGIAMAQANTTEDRMAWFRDAKFGMFIHFGVDNKMEFNPVGF